MDTINHSHGDTGTQPQDGEDFQSGEIANPETFDWSFAVWPDTIDEIIEYIHTIDPEEDGVVAEAEYANDADASTVKGNDIDSNGDGVVDNADHANTADSATQADNADTVAETDIYTEYISVTQGGEVPSGDALCLWQGEVAAGDTLSIEEWTFIGSNGTAVPTGVDMEIVTLDGSGGGTVVGTIVSGDGTAHLSESTNTTWSNTSGTTTHVGVYVDNGHFGGGSGSKADVTATIHGSINA